MNEQFSEIFGDTLPEGFGEEPTCVVQRVGRTAPNRGPLLDAYDQDVVLDNPGPTPTPTETPVVHHYQNNPKDSSVLERHLFLQNYSGLAGLALDNGTVTSITWGETGDDGKVWYYSYNATTGSKKVGRSMDALKESTTSATKSYIQTEGTRRIAERNEEASGSSSSSSSSKKKGMSKKGATALGAGIGAGVGELAKSLASMLGPQTAAPLTQEELMGTTPTEASSGVPWGWVLGGAGVLLVGGVLIFAVSRGGGHGSSEE